MDKDFKVFILDRKEFACRLRIQDTKAFTCQFPHLSQSFHDLVLPLSSLLNQSRPQI